MRNIVTFLIACLIAGLGWFVLNQPMTPHAAWLKVVDLFDERPSRRILLVGNSRTYFNDMPGMLRAIADAEGEPNKFQIKMEAFGGATFESHWNNPKTQAALTETWDDAIFQTESGTQVNEASEQSFRRFGKLLVNAVKLKGSQPRIVVNWGYGPEIFSDGDPDGIERATYSQKIQRSTAEFCEDTNAVPVNVGSAWARVTREHPEIRLTEDGNHPTVAGSYLYALVLYAELTKRSVSDATFTPNGLDPEVAATLRKYY